MLCLLPYCLVSQCTLPFPPLTILVCYQERSILWTFCFQLVLDFPGFFLHLIFFSLLVVRILSTLFSIVIPTSSYILSVIYSQLPLWVLLVILQSMYFFVFITLFA